MSHLREVDIADAPTMVNAETVQLLEKMLAMAKSGELQEMVAAGIMGDGNSYYGFTGTLRARDRVSLIEFVKAQWMREWLEDVV